MSKIKELFVKIVPDFLQQIVRNQYYEFKIAKSSEKDEPDLLVIAKMIQEGQHVLDIGANYGIYTKHLSAYVGKNGKVFSFEPITKTYSSLVHNVKTLQLKNVKTFKKALSDKKGNAEMYIPDYKEGGENLYEASLSNTTSSGKSVEVETAVLDELFEEKTKIDFIKIDVEGHEMSVLNGGKSILEKSKPFLLVEINNGIKNDNLNAMEIVSFLKKFGYSPFKRMDENLQKVKEDDDGFNYFFLTNTHEEKYKSLIIV